MMKSTPTFDHAPRTWRCTSYVGRVGALAIALGAGAVIVSMPTAMADSAGSDGSTGSSSSSSSAGSGTADSEADSGDAAIDAATDAATDTSAAASGGSPQDRSPDGPDIVSSHDGADSEVAEITAAIAREITDEAADDADGQGSDANRVHDASDRGEDQISELDAAPDAVESTTVAAVPGAAADAPGPQNTGDPAAVDEVRLFGNGTAEHPNAGILFGSGFSWDADSCSGGVSCNGGNAGLFGGNGGAGFNGGNGGLAGWFGNGGNGGAGVPGIAGGNGGNGGRGGLIFGSGGNGGDGTDAPIFGGAAGKGGAAGSGGLFGTDGQSGNDGTEIDRASTRGGVSIDLPPMPVGVGESFTVSPEFIAGFAADYLTVGGDPADGARFFFGDLAIASLDALADEDITPERARLLLGNLAVSGYFGGVWLRDNLRETSAVTQGDMAAEVGLPPDKAAAADFTASSIAFHLFDALAGALAGTARSTNGWLVTTAARASVPVLLALYGYNRGYLEVVLENPPDGVPSMQESLRCDEFLDCRSTAFPLEIATRYDAVLGNLDSPPGLRWSEMALWASLLQGVTGAGRSVWEGGLVQRGAFSPVSYAALVELSSAYLMVSKAAVLASMGAFAEGDTDTGRSSLRLQAGLWIWSGTYFGGLASGAPVGTMPAINVVAE